MQKLCQPGIAGFPRVFKAGMAVGSGFWAISVTFNACHRPQRRDFPAWEKTIADAYT
jgi:hypothetical protein